MSRRCHPLTVNPKATDCVSLEPLTAAHAAELFPVLSHAAIYSYIAGPPPASVSALAERFRRLESRSSPDGSQQWLNWAIRHSESQERIGYVQATVHAAGTADFAFVLAPRFWGLGYAYEASLVALSSLFIEFGVSSVYATADRRNLRSSALLLRLGFLQVPSASYPHGTTEDSDDVFRLNRNALTMSASPVNPARVVAHSFQNRAEVERSESCACFHCFARFTPAEIRYWTDSDDPDYGDWGPAEPDFVRYPGQTATCPSCKVDSVIGSASGYALTDEFLRSLHEHWHGTKFKPDA